MTDIHENSRQSYFESEDSGRCRTYREKIVALLTKTGREMTDREIQTKLNVAEKSNIQPEITRLRQAGVLAETGKVKCPETGKTVRTVCINNKLRETLL